MRFFSPETGGFHNLPGDPVEISDDDYKFLMDNQSGSTRFELVDNVVTAVEIPIVPPTRDQKIMLLESKVTARHLRGAALGDEFAIDAIQAIEDQIAALR